MTSVDIRIPVFDPHDAHFTGRYRGGTAVLAHPIRYDDRTIDVPEMPDGTAPVLTVGEDGRQARPCVRWHDRFWLPVSMGEGFWLPVGEADDGRDLGPQLSDALRRGVIVASDLADDVAILGDRVMFSTSEPLWSVNLFEWRDIQARITFTPAAKTTIGNDPFVFFRADRGADAAEYCARLKEDIPVLREKQYRPSICTVHDASVLGRNDISDTLAVQGPCLIKAIHRSMDRFPRDAIEDWLALRNAGSDATSAAAALSRIGRTPPDAGLLHRGEEDRWLWRAQTAARMLALRLRHEQLPDAGGDFAADDLEALAET